RGRGQDPQIRDDDRPPTVPGDHGIGETSGYSAAHLQPERSDSGGLMSVDSDRHFTKQIQRERLTSCGAPRRAGEDVIVRPRTLLTLGRFTHSRFCRGASRLFEGGRADWLRAVGPPIGRSNGRRPSARRSTRGSSGSSERASAKTPVRSPSSRTRRPGRSNPGKTGRRTSPSSPWPSSAPSTVRPVATPALWIYTHGWKAPWRSWIGRAVDRSIPKRASRTLPTCTRSRASDCPHLTPLVCATTLYFVSS